MFPLIGFAPEAYEAALLAAYPGRPNPIIQALCGELSVRELRVMLEHLPPGNAAQRELEGPWGDQEWLLYDVSSYLRYLRTDFFNANRGRQPPIRDTDLLPTPHDRHTGSGAPAETRSAEQVQAERDHLEAVLARKNPH